MDLAERNRLIAVTKGFQCLQGLIYAPMALSTAAISLIDRAWPMTTSAMGGWAGLAILLCGFAASFAARSYYRRRFGVVRSKGLSPILGAVAPLALVVAMYVDGSFWTHPAASYPVSFTCLWWALFYVACYLHPFAARPHSLWFAALFLGCCFLTSTGVVPKSQFFLGSGSGHVGDLLIWLAFSLYGLLDHLLLLRLLPKASPEQSTGRHD
jgi:hypothetical protein